MSNAATADLLREIAFDFNGRVEIIPYGFSDAKRETYLASGLVETDGRLFLLNAAGVAATAAVVLAPHERRDYDRDGDPEARVLRGNRGGRR